MNRRGFLTALLSAAALPVIPVLGPISDTKRTFVGWNKINENCGTWYIPHGVLKRYMLEYCPETGTTYIVSTVLIPDAALAA